MKIAMGGRRVPTGSVISSSGFVMLLALAACGDNWRDPTAGALVVTKSGDVRTTEAGGADTFTVALAAAPARPVTVDVTSSDPTEGVASPATLRFTPDDWDQPRTVTVTGVDDDVADGDRAYAIRLVSGVLPTVLVDAVNADDDTAGITASPTTGLTTIENGAVTTFTVVLDSQPLADVVVEIASDDPGEGVAEPSALRFTPANWNAPQQVTVTGVDDDEADGPQPYAVRIGPAISDDPGYDGLEGAPVELVNLDDDSAGVYVTPVAGLVTTEAGGADTFTVVMLSRPTAAVTIPVGSSDPSEGAVAPAALVFTPDDWNAPRTVTVTGVDDPTQDGDQPWTAVLGPAVSADPGYDGLDVDDVAVVNLDDDSAGVVVAPRDGLVTTEAGGTDTFTVVLLSRPTASVTFPLASSDPGEGTVAPASLTFTPDNWNAPRTVTVTGVDDLVADGHQPWRARIGPATSADPNYQGLDGGEALVRNLDDDSAGIRVAPTSGLVTTEAGGSASFTVVLLSQPTANVVVPLASDDATEGTVAPASLTFTPVNWNAARTVTVTGVDDLVADGDQVWRAWVGPAVSADPGYHGLDGGFVTITNRDDDAAGVIVAPLAGLTTTEAGGSDTFSIVLLSQPTADVTFALSSSRPAEGTVAPASVTFTPVNWNAPRTITVTGVDDQVADGNQVWSARVHAAVSADPGYAGLDPPDPTVTNLDDDSAGIRITPTAGLVTTEAGGTATFTVVLLSQPLANVTIPVVSDDLTEGTVAPASLTFTPLNWNAPQQVTVTGVNDDVADGNQAYRALVGPAGSADPGYQGLAGGVVNVTNLDDDSEGIRVTPTVGLATTEAGGTATFTIVLLSQPLADVVVPVASDRPSEGTVAPASVTFTPLNWNAPRTITATGVDDLVADGDQVWRALVGPATSADPGYHGLTGATVTLVNRDNDAAGVVVTPLAGLVTTEAGATDTFTIVLLSQPTADVTFALTSSNAGEGTVAPASVTFTPQNWNAPRTVTVTGVDDLVADGNQVWFARIGPAASADPGYAGLDPPDPQVTNVDNDSAGVIVAPTAGLVTTEGGGDDFFTVVLTSQPIANVTIHLASDRPAEGTASPAVLTFTTADWSLPRTVTVTGVDDAVADGDQVYRIILSPAVSADPGYQGLDPADVTVTNLDDDEPDTLVDPTDGLLVTEFGDEDTFEIVLTSQPAANVTISLTSSDLTEGTVSPASVTFTPGNWSVPQTVTVTGVNDGLVDGDQVFFIVTGAAVSADPAYHGIDPPDVRVVNIDDESPAVVLKARKKLQTSESGQFVTFRMRLTLQPTANVACAFTSTRPDEGTVNPTSVTFTPGNFGAWQTVRVTGVDDTIVDGNQLYQIVTHPCTSADARYHGYDPPDLTVINRDND